MNMLLEDLRFAWRTLRRAPGFSVLAVGVLALGIGATTVIYGVLKGVVLDPLPFPDQDRLIVVNETNPPQFPRFSVSPGNYMSWRGEVQAFESLSMAGGGWFNLTGRDEPARLRGAVVTSEYFMTLGVGAALGRTFTPADTEGDIVVLSHGAWMTYLGGDTGAVGRSLTLNGRSYTVLGVMPPEFRLSSQANDLYTPWHVTAEEAQNHGGHYTSVIGRLRPGATREQAQAELDTVAKRLEREFPASNLGWGVITRPLAEALLGDTTPRLFMLLGGVALVLLIACANVASLTLVRASGRAHEFAIRRAQGATAWRLARQLLTEGLVLASVGGLAGLALAALALPLVREFAPAGLPRIDQVRLDLGVALVAGMVSLAAGLAASAVPAWLATRRAVAGDLRDGGRGATGARGSRTRSALVVGEVALAVVLLAGAGLLTRSLASLTAVDPGFSLTDNGYTRLALPGTRYGDDPAAARFYTELTERIDALPGVGAAGVVQSLPMVSDYVLSFDVDGRPAPAPGAEPSAIYYAASPGYLPAMGIRLVRGRLLTDADRAGAARVMLVSESFAARHFPGQEVLGQRIRPGNGDDAWREIVGVVSDVRQYGLDSDLEPQMYEPFAQAPFHSAFVVFDSATGAAGVAAAVRAAVKAIDPDQPMGEVQTVASAVEATLASRRFATWLLGLFAATALALAAIGLYGTLAYAVSQSTRELGVRIALGAQARDVLRLVVGHGLALVASGAFLGVLAALAGARLIEGMVFGIPARDPLTLTVIVTLMLTVALAASALPAWRATRVDPMEALRHE